MTLPFVSNASSEQICTGSHEIQWREPLNTLALKKNEVHLWRLNLENSYCVPEWDQVLSPEEVVRAKRFIIPEKRKQFIAAHILLHMILSAYMQNSAQDIRLDYQPGGKPILWHTLASENIQFSLTHSNQWMLAAISRRIPLGIDLEHLELIKEKKWILENLFAEDDRERYQHLSPHEQDETLIRVWTLKEAVLKSVGLGICNSKWIKQLNCLGMNFSSDATFRQINGEPFWMFSFKPVAGFLGSMAALTITEPKIYYWDANLSTFPQLHICPNSEMRFSPLMQDYE